MTILIWEQLYYPSGPNLIVESLDVFGGDIEVTIKNDGDTAVIDEFWTNFAY